MSNRILTLLSQQRLNENYRLGFWQDHTIFSTVKAHAKTSPDRIAVRDRMRTLTYGGLIGEAERFAGHLAAQGVQAGDRVAVWLSSRTETAVALLACSRNGYVCCPSLHRDHTSAEVIELMQRMRAAAFVGEQGYGADAARRDVFAHLDTIPTLKAVVCVLKAGNATDGAALPLAPPAGQVNSDPNVVVYLAFTSGTTGKPKGVMHSDNTLLANARAMIADWRFGPQTVIYTMSPLSHNLGLGSLVTGLAAGGQVVVHDLPRGASTLDRINEVAATFVVGVPTHAVDLLAEIRTRGVAPATIRGFRISGASAPSDVVAELLRYGMVPQSGYGMTEAGSHHYTRMTDTPERIVQTSGRACDGYEVKIWSTENPDQEVAIGDEGQIGGRGASLMLGYFDDQAANDEAFNSSGWFMTGDIGRLDADGYLRITGRKKDLIIRGGHNIYPARIENLATQHPAVARAAALPVPDARLGEKVCLIVTPVAGQDIMADDILAHLDRVGLSRYDMPEYFAKLDRIPLTASGKILKRDLVAQIADGRLVPLPVRWQPPRASTST